MALSQLLLRRFNCSKPPSIRLLSHIPNSLNFSSLPASPDATSQSSATAKPTSLSARMNFIFEQIDEIDNNREEKDQTLQRIRAWRESKKQRDVPIAEAAPDPSAGDPMTEALRSELVKSEAFLGNSDGFKEVELVHPWPEWIELMERLLQQNYFDHRRKDEDGMMQGLGFDMSEASAAEDKRPDFPRNFKIVQAAMVNFGRDRFDILRSLSRQDLQLLVGYGCPSPEKKVSYSGKLLRKYVHLDEGDVCSSCNLRGSCEKAYLLTNKEDEVRTIDVMRILLAYGFEPINGSLENKSLLKMKSVKTVVRKLLHQIVKLSAVPIDPNLPPPVIKKPPPKVKQPPPPPRKRVGRDDIEMKKGDWLCPKCEFMNFAKNTVCLQCDAKRPKRQLLPGEWECPQCNFLNYRRNTDCFHCEHKRPPDTYPENHFAETQRGSHVRMDKKPARADVSNAWNFDFDDNESDGADVAAFENADSRKLDEGFPLNQQTLRESSRGYENDPERSRPTRGFDMEYSETSRRPDTGFNDFDEDDDDDDVDSYEVVSQNEVSKTSRVDLSELEADSESEDIESSGRNWNVREKAKSQMRGRKQTSRQAFSDSAEVDFDTDDDLPIHPNWKSSHVADPKQQNRVRNTLNFVSDDDSEDEDIRSKNRGNIRGSNRMDYTRGGRSNFRESLSEVDSDDDQSHKSGMQRDKRGLNSTGKSFRGRDSNRMDSLRGGRSNFNKSYSEIDSDDDQSYTSDWQRDKRGLNRPGKATRGRGSNRMDSTRGGRSNFNKSYSEVDSDDDQSYTSGWQRDNRGLNRPGKASRGRGSSRMDSTRGGRSSFNDSYSESGSDDDRIYKSDREGERRGLNRPGKASRGRGGMMSDRKGSRGGDFNRSSGPKSFNRSSSREDSYGGRGKDTRDSYSSKFQSNRRGGSSGKRGGRGGSFGDRAGSYDDGERQLRPRVNVR